MSEWLCIVRPPRPTFISDMSEHERAVMSRHFAYLEELLREGRLLLAGPAIDPPPFGIVVLVADSEAEAWELVRAPSVSSGVQTPELHPFRASLLAGRD